VLIVPRDSRMMLVQTGVEKVQTRINTRWDSRMEATVGADADGLDAVGHTIGTTAVFP